MSKERCPACGSDNTVYDEARGELICMNCGYVLDEDVIDTRPEWRAYDAEQRRRRARAELATSGAPAQTFIGDSRERSIQNRFKRLSNLHRNVSREWPRSLNEGREEISRVTAGLGLPSQVREEAQRIFTLAQRRGLLKGRGIPVITSACIMLACREYGVPYNESVLYRALGVDGGEARHCYMLLIKRLRDELFLKPPDPTRYIPMLTSRLKLSMDAHKTALAIVEAAGRARILFGKSPKSVAAAAVYLACAIHGLELDKAELAHAAGITDVTLRKRVKELLKNLVITVYI